jgi:hypothetical protein
VIVALFYEVEIPFCSRWSLYGLHPPPLGQAAGWAGQQGAPLGQAAEWAGQQGAPLGLAVGWVG